MPYNEAQWRWIAARWQEGYQLTALASFLGCSDMTVTRYLQDMGLLPYGQDELVPLSSRKEEFLSLAGGKPVRRMTLRKKRLEEMFDHDKGE